MNHSTIPQRPDDSREDAAAGDEGWLQKARAFREARMRLYWVRTAAALLFPFLFWYLGLSHRMEQALSAAIDPRWLLVPLYVLAYHAIAAILFLPLSYQSGFTIQHRFGLSRQSRSDWFSDWVKSTLLGAFFFVLGFGAFYLSLALFGESWWWILAIALSVVAVLLTYVAPVLLLPIFYKCSPLEDWEMVRRIEALAERAGARVSRVCAIDLSRRTVAANAALAGIGRTRQVLIGDTMLREFSPDEVETVVAHEFAHHVHRDIWKGLALEVGAIWAGLAALQFAVRPLLVEAGVGDVSVLANLPLLILLGHVASILIMPVANAVSRRYEAQADQFAARVSGMPDAYASALYRLARQNLAELWPPRWMELLLSSHPAIGRRIASVQRGRDTQPPKHEDSKVHEDSS
jgi:STE24 endopeptidase